MHSKSLLASQPLVQCRRSIKQEFYLQGRFSFFFGDQIEGIHLFKKKIFSFFSFQEQNGNGNGEADALAADMESMTLRGMGEAQCVDKFKKLMDSFQNPMYDFGVKEDPTYVVPMKISIGTVRQLRDAAKRQERAVREVALTLSSTIERLATVLLEAQMGAYRAAVASLKADDYLANKQESAQLAATARREQQKRTSALTVFVMPTIEEMIENRAAKRARGEPDIRP